MRRCIVLLLGSIIVLLSLTSILAIPDVSFTLNADSTATIRVNGQIWLRTDATWFHALNTTFSTADSTLGLASTKEHQGQDSLGRFRATTLTWTTKSSPPLTFLTTYRVYSHPMNPDATQSIVFEQQWVTGAAGTAAGNSDSVLSAFPTFRPAAAAVPLGAMQWVGDFNLNQVFVFAGPNSSLPLAKGGPSGPIVLFDKRGAVSAVLSSFSSFMSASNVASKDGQTVEFGVAGSMTSVPAGYSLETIAVFDDRGISQSVLTWGDALLRRYGKRREAYQDDFTNVWLGYATDNGAFYYYNTEPGKTYETTLLDVNRYALANSIPYRHMLLDSWWYYKGALNGAKNWTAMTSIFPSGLQALHANLTYGFVAHNRWWAPETDYAKQNGGQYDFVFGNNYGLPTEQRFWDDLMRNASVWGLRVYEQDWLSAVWKSLPQMTTDITLGRTWLIQMGQGAAKAGVGIQYQRSAHTQATPIALRA